MKKNTNLFYNALDNMGIQWGMHTTVHDSLFSIFKPEDIEGAWAIAKTEAVKSKMRIPILIDGDVAIGHWGNYTPIKTTVREALCTLQSATRMSLICQSSQH
jgi:hypothetical protein